MPLHSTPLHSTHSTHSTYLFKIFFSLLTLSTAFLQKACGPGKKYACRACTGLRFLTVMILSCARRNGWWLQLNRADTYNECACFCVIYKRLCNQNLLQYNPVEQNLEGIDYRSLDVIDFELVEKIGNYSILLEFKKTNHHNINTGKTLQLRTIKN